MQDPASLPALASLDDAIASHRAGQFDQAIAAYRSLIDAGSAHAPDAWNLMGLAYRSLGQHPSALMAANHAVALARHPKFLSDRSTVFLDLGQFDLALTDARAALNADPNHLEAGINAVSALRGLKEHAKAVRLARKHLALYPDSADLWNNLGASLLDQQLVDEAKHAFEEAHRHQPQHLQALENLARLAWVQDEQDKAAPLSAEAYALGCADTQVLAPWAQHLKAQPLDTDLDARSQRELLLRDIWIRLMTQGRDDQLVALLDGTDVRNDLFSASSQCQRTGEKDLSVRMLSRALALLPDDPDITNNLGVACFASENYSEALAHFQKGLALRGDFAVGLRNVGVCHFMLVHPEEARVAFEKAYALDPDSVATCLYFFGQALQCCDWPHYEELMQRIIAQGAQATPADDLTASLAYLTGVEKAEDMRKIAPRVADTLAGRMVPALVRTHLPFQRKPRLRVGYFSYDFRAHPVGYLTEEIYGLHDRSKFEVLALSYGPDDGSTFRRTIRESVDQFIDLRDMTTAERVQRIRGLDLDILVDLTGNTQGTASEVVMHRVAPIQCHWLGYVWSMGHASYDYIIADPFSIPPQLEHGYVENAARLPYTLQVSSRQLRAADKTLTRASQGLPEDAFVMCNFGSFVKLQPHLFDAWLRILQATPNAVLWLARTNRAPLEAFDRLRSRARGMGVRDEQLVFSEPMGREEHLLRYQLADLALDTYPQGSGTTAIEALWMGCPMVSMADAGDTLAIRMAGGILNAVELSELVTSNLADYEALVLALARDPQRLKALRQHLVSQRDRLPLFDTPQQVKYLERCFERMASQAEQPSGPSSFTIPPQ